MDYIVKLFLTFIIFSFLGWFLEEIYAIFIAKVKTNRGFLVGPLCPIYGFTSVILILLLNGFKDNYILLFILSVIIAAVIEYFTSFILEKVFNVKLWDYSKDSKYELKGRIAIYTLIPFGLLGIIVIRYVNPFISNLLNYFNNNTLLIVSIIILIFLIIDIIFSLFVIKHTKGSGDVTDEKNKIVKKHIKKTTKIVKEQIKDTNNNIKKTTNKVKEQIIDNNIKKIIKK